MANCPFWSNGNQKVSCYTECPMSKEYTSEECVFSLYLNPNGNERDRFRTQKFTKSTFDLEFKNIDENRDDIIGNLRFLTSY